MAQSTTVIEFQLDRDVSQAVDDVRDAVTRIRTNLPGEIEEPIISRVTTTGGALLTFGISSQSMSEEELSWFVDMTVNRELSSIAGIGVVRRVGGVDREIRVDLDPDALNSLGTTAGDISRQLRRTQVELPGGEARVGNQEQSVRTVADGPRQSRTRHAAHHSPRWPHVCDSMPWPRCATRRPSNASSRCSTASSSSGSK